MSVTLRRWGLVTLAVLLAAGGIWYASRPEPVTVPVAAVDRGTVEATVANTRAGTVEARRRAKLAPDVSGRVTRLTVSEGDRIEKGEILLELWNKDRRADVALSRAQTEAAEARVEQACDKADAAAREADRLLRLQKKGMASEEAVDRAVTERKSTAAGCRAARAEEEVAVNQVKAARARLERTILRAPFTGTVGEINAELGEIVTPSPPGIPTPPAIDLIDGDRPYVSAPIDEVDAPAIRVGMPARIHLDAYPDRTFPARVRRIDPYVRDTEKQARTVEVEVAFEDPATVDGLMPGYSADAEIILNRRDGVLRVPTEAIVEGRVLVLGKDGRLRERSVETGLSNWELTEVTSGLKAGARVVLTPNREGVEPGAPAVPEGPGNGE